MFFAAYEPLKNFIGEIKIPTLVNGKQTDIILKYRSTHTTYRDNPNVSPQRIAFHESLKQTNYFWYKVFTLGEWGNKENENPWAFAFNRERHVADRELFANSNYNLHLSFDFNRSPATCSVIQHHTETIWVIETIKLQKSGTEALCDHILFYYPGYVYIISGDYSGHNKSSIYKDEISNYTMIKQKLHLSDGQIKVKTNPRLAGNQLLVNALLYKYNIQMCPVKAKGMIFDMRM
jgi:hypothetical protein